MSIGQELLNVPMGDMIREMAFAIADGQMKLDEASMRSAEMMGGLKTIRDVDGKVTFEDSRVFFGAEYMTLGAAIALGYTDPSVPALAPNKVATIQRFKAIDNALPVGISKTITIDDAVAGVECDVQYVAAYLRQAVIAFEAASGTPKTDLQTHIADVRSKSKISGVDFAQEVRIPSRLSMLELGFAPVFYQFIDTIIEVKISISISRSSESTISTGTESKSGSTNISFRPFKGRASAARTVSTSQVNATYSSKYSYSAEGSSLLRTKLVPLPPPAILEQRIQAQMEDEAARRAAKLEAMLPPPPAKAA